MPITPFHIIAGVAAKSISPKYFSWTVFALANVLIDTEAVYYYGELMICNSMNRMCEVQTDCEIRIGPICETQKLMLKLRVFYLGELMS